ncbi:hypothetical protein QFC21_006110 [Naganishia friedmannii]|uniref:Uncharacterized protein n=1 Tax=Naganishia friedmannii TaxID=89922 RepID=A0ACC2V4K8_9TREE|nr:hypothetical protein QFC21_006110 [Naganishia friedmannii]
MESTAQANPSRSYCERIISTFQGPEMGEDHFGQGKKRKIRHVRVKTGCRDCRMRRIKCPEGITVAEGAKVPCEKCDETGTPCWYPAPDDLGRTTTRWVQAVVLNKDDRVVATVESTVTVKHGTSDDSRPAPAPPARPEPMQHDIYAQQLLQHPMRSYQEIKQERPPTPILHFPTNQPPLSQLRQPLLPYYYVPSEATAAEPSHQSPSMFVEPSLGNPSHIPATIPSSEHPYTQQPPIQPLHSERGITLPRIPKGIGTFRDQAGYQWPGNFPAPHSQPYRFAPPTGNVPAPPAYNIPVPSSRTPYMDKASASVSTPRRHGTYQQQVVLPWSQHNTNPGGEFRLQMTRIPWMKRKPMHVDHTRSTGGQSKASLDALMETGVAAAPPLVPADNLHRYLASVNPPVRPLQSFNLASMLTSPLERMAMAYFETRGCVEIIAAGEMKSNWIYAQVFPRVYELFTSSGERVAGVTLSTRGRDSGTGIEVARMEARQLIKQYVYHSLIRLSCVHRANIECEPFKIEALRREVRAHEKRATRAGLMARINFPESAWKTEEYLTGTFIGYMADVYRNLYRYHHILTLRWQLLDSRTFQVDLGLMAVGCDHVCSGFETILREMVSVYHTLLTAFLPHDPLVPVRERSRFLLLSNTMVGGAGAMDIDLGRPLWDTDAARGVELACARPSSAPVRSHLPTPALAMTSASSAAGVVPGISALAAARTVVPVGMAEDWVESFFGLTRDMILRVGQVNGMVARRAELLRGETEEEEAGWTLRRAAERMVTQLEGAGDTGGGWIHYGREEPNKAGHSGSALGVAEMAPGRPSRIRRGTTVVGIGLVIIILCELLDFDLEDPRLTEAADRALEMVADSQTSETAGLSWTLMVSVKVASAAVQDQGEWNELTIICGVQIAAIYTRSPARRDRIMAVLRTTEAWSWGTGYIRGTQEIMETCWMVLDKEGGYRYGIAPWREAMAVAGRSFYW